MYPLIRLNQNTHIEEIQPFLSQEFDVGRLLDNYIAKDSYEYFLNQWTTMNNEKRENSMERLLSGYIYQSEIKKWFYERQLFDKPQTGSNPVAFEDLQISFEKMIHSMYSKLFGISYNPDRNEMFYDLGKVSIFIENIFHLCVIEDRNDSLFIYKSDRGIWTEGDRIVRQTYFNIIECSSRNGRSAWSNAAENKIVEILTHASVKKKFEVFNNRYYAFGNMTFDTIEMKMIPHSKEHYLTMGSDVLYKPEEKCPNFDNFLLEIFDHDMDRVQFTVEFFGYCIDTSHLANVLLIAVGGGSNGKSTLLDILAKLIGPRNVSATPLSNFKDPFGLQPLLGKKLNVSTESDMNGFNTSKLKAVTAGEPITVNRKHLTEVQTILPIKLAYAVNELPRLLDTSHGLQRRLKILPFQRQFKPSEQDIELSNKLTKELSGILNLAIEGFIRLKSNGYNFTESTMMEREKERYFVNKSSLSEFVEECVVIDKEKKLFRKDFFNMYIKWAADNGIEPDYRKASLDFWREAEKALSENDIKIEVYKTGGYKAFKGITLK